MRGMEAIFVDVKSRTCDSSKKMWIWNHSEENISTWATIGRWAMHVGNSMLPLPLPHPLWHLTFLHPKGEFISLYDVNINGSVVVGFDQKNLRHSKEADMWTDISKSLPIDKRAA